MRDLTSNPLWPYLKRARNYQKNLGYISAFLLTVALLALLDGLQAQMRGGSREFSLLPGSTMGLSGPSALKNPVDSDLLARFSPPDSPLSFAMEGFFSGYWFGNGMWRGKIIVPDNTPPGGYELIISFKGASAQSAQRYGLSICANARDAREASLSFIKRFFNLNPFIVASIAGGAGVFFGLLTWFFGRRYILGLFSLGILQAYPAGDGTLFCFCRKNRAPSPGAPCVAYDEDGSYLSDGNAEEWRKGKLFIRMERPVDAEGAILVRAWTPGSRD